MIVVGVIGWLVAVVAGLLTLTAYDTAPGIAATPPGSWPADSRLAHDDGRSTLVLVLHPHCPCSRASVDELARLMPAFGDRVRVHVLMVAPDGTPTGWSDGDLADEVAALPGVETTVDGGAVEAARFGAVTSGQTYLFAPDGTLRFSGGITPARGHHGDSAGRAAVLAALTSDPPPETARTFVFGCALTGDRLPPGLLDAWRNALHAFLARWRGEAAV
jgi:hypothetical protein